jgi:hypothetical protein
MGKVPEYNIFQIDMRFISFVRVRNFISDITREHGAKENIWTEKG